MLEPIKCEYIAIISFILIFCNIHFFPEKQLYFVPNLTNSCWNESAKLPSKRKVVNKEEHYSSSLWLSPMMRAIRQAKVNTMEKETKEVWKPSIQTFLRVRIQNEKRYLNTYIILRFSSFRLFSLIYISRFIPIFTHSRLK